MIHLVDNTLRDGEQSPGVMFSSREKMTIAYLLADSGIKHIEAGCPAVCEEERDTIKVLAKSGIDASIYSWNRAKKEDIVFSFLCGVKNLIISMPVSDQMITKKLRKNRNYVLDHFSSVVEFAVERGAEVVCGLEDASRADITFLKKLCMQLEKSGADRIRISDTLGVLYPEKTTLLIKEIKSIVGIPIEFHGHNNFGLANANAISAFLAGAEYIDTSILGIGDGCGITALEEFVSGVEFILKIPTGVNIGALKSLADTLLLALKLELWPWKPVLGKNNYTHESGIHIDGLLKDPENYEIVSPESFGIRRKFVLGKHSGKHSVAYFCKILGLETSNIDIEHLTNLIKQKTIAKNEVLSVDEIRKLYFMLITENHNIQAGAVCF
ncbi:MAG: homoaconitate hydratase [Spirochaetia bacterium]|nr:homoaconitate hydratase [Spirochaetia bacterium]